MALQRIDNHTHWRLLVRLTLFTKAESEYQLTELTGVWALVGKQRNIITGYWILMMPCKRPNSTISLKT
jgi:hypothetical protein